MYYFGKIADLRPKGRGRPQRILLGVWPDDHIRGVIRAVVFRDTHTSHTPHGIKEEVLPVYPAITVSIPYISMYLSLIRSIVIYNLLTCNMSDCRLFTFTVMLSIFKLILLRIIFSDHRIWLAIIISTINDILTYDLHLYRTA